MNLFTVTLFAIILIAVVDGGVGYLKKCCKATENLESVNGTFRCAEDATKRLQILVNGTNFLEQNIEGECVDVSDGFFVFNVSGKDVSKVKPASDKVYPKCCPPEHGIPLSSTFLPRKKDSDHSYIEENFITVGLPNCRVIVDYELNSTTQYGLRDYSSIQSRNISDYAGSYCFDENEEGSFMKRKCKETIQVCEHVKCIKKCCPDGQSFKGGPFCYDTYEHGLNLSTWDHVIKNSTDPYAIIYNRTCSSLFIMKEEKHHFTLDNQGVLTYSLEDKTFVEDIGNMNSYCMEHTETSNLNKYMFFMCFEEYIEDEKKYKYTFYPLILSCAFLLLTIIIYVLLGETKKMFGKILANYCAAMILQYAVLALAITDYIPTATECQVKAFIILFSVTASFTWSNILCWDIWCTFGTTKRFVGAKQWTMEFKKILTYGLYGWGIPLLLTLIVYFFYMNNQILPYVIQPLLAEERCSYERKPGNYSKILFFSFPLLIIQLINTVLFIKTVMYCLRVKNEINKINDTTKDSRTKKFQKDKERLFLILKLLIIMGISFLFEVVSGFFDMNEMGDIPRYIEIIWDVINASQGIFIFIIFICKKKVYNSCMNKIKTPNMSRVSSAHTHSSNMLNAVALNTFVSVNKNEK